MVDVHCIDAGHGDCILIVSNDVRILIDSGPKSFKVSRQVSQAISHLAPDGIIDLAIVTHNDDDHIGGFKYLIKNDVITPVKILFNSVEVLNSLINKNGKKISYKQDGELYKILESKGIGLISKSYRKDVSEVITVGDLKVTVIAPNEDGLREFERWKKNKEIESFKVKISSLKHRDVSILSCLENFKEDLFVEDNSSTNRSSIAVVIENEIFRGLFLGDAHAKDIVSFFNENKNFRRDFDLVKISHHGSERNTSQELLNILECNNFVICSNKRDGHKHPDSMLIARIVSVKPNAFLHFTSKSDELLRFLSGIEDMVKLNFPTSGINSIKYV